MKTKGYTFSETCEEETELKLLDGTRTIFYNCTYAGEDIPEDLRMLYDYVETGKAENELTKKLDFAVYKAKHNEEWGMEYLKEWQILLEQKEEGREEEASERISNMLRRGKTVDEIVDFCGYPKEQVEEVEKAMMATEQA